MKLKFEGFFGKKDNSDVVLPKINKGGITVDNGGCYGESKVKITLPHITFTDKNLEEKAAENHTYTFKL